jgi:3-(3-hydroxy-phenyl)propionate hydroxylase
LLIVGGGPVGLTLALDLGRRGHRVVLINKHDFIAGGSKAICFAKRTLDIWDRLGVGERMVAKGVVWNVGKVFWGAESEPIYQFDILPVKHQRNPGFINLQQYYAEEYLVDAVRDLPNVELRWGHELVGIDSQEDGVHATVDAGGETYRMQTDWLLACDGCRSATREMLGLDFQGRVFEDNFLIADIKVQEERPSERWFWFDPPFNAGKSALLHKQPDHVWRLDFQLGWDIDRDACVRPENVEPLVRGMLGPDVRWEKEWYSVYTFQCRRMERFLHGRVIFAGDSAHLVSPFGARGCNNGIADADNLAWKLDLVIRGSAPRDLLESYNFEAVVTADENILNSSRSTDFMTPKSAVAQTLRDATLELASQHEFALPFVNSGRLSTAVAYPASPLNTPDSEEWDGGVPPGSPALDAPVSDGYLLGALGDRFVLLCDGLEARTPNGLEVLEVESFGDPVGLVRSRYAMEPGSAYLIRPDQYVAARWRSPTEEQIRAAMQRAMCTP